MTERRTESVKALRRRWEVYTEHRVIGYVHREHSMNGRPCKHPWAVMEFEHSDEPSFYCGECGVGIQWEFGASGKVLADLWREKR